MGAASLPLSKLPGTRRLYADLLYDFPGVGKFFPHRPSVEAAKEAATDVGLDGRHRQRLVDELRRQNHDGGAATVANLDRLASPGTVVVATGQQVGLLGGPVFTLYKVLTAVRCAEELTKRGTPAVPVFWLATEDHDLDEVNHNWVFGPLVRLAGLRPLPKARPVQRWVKYEFWMRGSMWPRLCSRECRLPLTP